eukprot:Skav211663  [mRNA]  locus=scaffold216:6429:10050:- [translate_table: standard]
MSMSSTFSPACWRDSEGRANAHELGIHATQAKLRKRAMMGKPNFLATERLAINTMEAPSVNWLLLPAVVLPPALKA